MFINFCDFIGFFKINIIMLVILVEHFEFVGFYNYFFVFWNVWKTLRTYFYDLEKLTMPSEWKTLGIKTKKHYMHNFVTLLRSGKMHPKIHVPSLQYIKVRYQNCLPIGNTWRNTSQHRFRLPILQLRRNKQQCVWVQL